MRKDNKKIVALRPKINSYLTDDRSKGHKEVCDETRNKIPRLQRLSEKKLKQYWNPNKASGVRHTVYTLKRSTKSHVVQMMIREYKRLT